MNNGYSSNHGNYSGNFYPNYTAPGHGGGGNAPRAGCNVYNRNSRGHGVGGINVARQYYYTANRLSGHSILGSGPGNVSSNFDKRLNLVQNSQQYNAHFGPATNMGVLFAYVPTIRPLTEISLDTDQIRVESVDGLISLS